MEIDTITKAIILIEFQKQWTEKGFFNFYHRLIRKELTTRTVVENSRSFIQNARNLGFRIIHAPLIIDPKNKKGWLARITFGRVFTKGTWKAEFTDGLFKEGDLVIKGRYAFDAFIGSDLEQILTNFNIETVFFCGFTTDQCIEKTMKTAFKKGWNSYLVSDCTAARNNKIQRKVEENFANYIMDSKMILDRSSK